ncbi:hypothetical protein ML401_20215 [Bradyrhizobium sp. 62B]|uniref:hypothetical protein n=1 Tax=Bradyrhizobium sp. 62B TaxID=2898442 RepID=UPI00255825AC|nr:hypothetical protein ML401_20215 [Bradyrhizobium sp. 62B]
MSARPPYDMDSFYKFRNADPDEEAPEGSVLAADVDLVVAELCPSPDKLEEHHCSIEECRRSIALAIWKIRQVDLSRTAKPGLVKKQLNRIETAARKLRVEISRLPDDVARKLRPANFGRLIEKSAVLASKITVRASGGAKPARLARARKMVAARHAFSLCYFCEGIQSRTKDGPYVRLTELLFKTATGKQGSCANACSEQFKELHEYGLFDETKWRQEVATERKLRAART